MHGILQSAKELSVQSGVIQVGLGWDVLAGKPKVDLDASAICFSSTGILRDAAFYNQLHACNSAVVHSGDVKGGEKEGYDETISVNLDEVKGVNSILFLISAYSGGSLDSVESAYCDIKQNESVLANVATSTGDSGSKKMGMLICILFRHPDNLNWHFCKLVRPVPGRHFSACMLQMREIVDQVVDPGLLTERSLSKDRTFNMEKGDQLSIPTDLHKLTVGLGWSTAQDKLDLDASCILLRDVDNDGDLDPVRVVYFARSHEPGVASSGDNKTGEGEGDDEQIFLDLKKVDKKITALAIIVNVYTLDRTFSDVTNSYVRLTDSDGKHEYARYTLGTGGSKSNASNQGAAQQGLIFCMLYRNKGWSSGWTLQSVGEPCEGRTVFDVRTKLWDGTPSRNQPLAGEITARRDGDGCCVVQ